MAAAGIARRMQSVNAFDASRFVPFICDTKTIGWVRRDLAVHLRAYPDVLRVTDTTVDLVVASRTVADRSAAMAHVAAGLAARGLLTRWRNELYEIGAEVFGAPVFALERAAVRFFGFVSSAVHLNGIVPDDGQWWMWIARRSPAKSIDPDMYDNMMGGGVASGLGIEQTLVKEAWEEAGIPASLAQQAVAVGVRFVRREVHDGVHAEGLHMFDLVLPADFRPVNQDGEVASFRRLTFEQVVAELCTDAPYTGDAGLVAIDCLRRRGALPQ